MKSRSIDTIVKCKRFKNHEGNSRNVLFFIIEVTNKNNRPPDLSQFKKKIVDNLKNKESQAHEKTAENLSLIKKL